MYKVRREEGDSVGIPVKKETIYGLFLGRWQRHPKYTIEFVDDLAVRYRLTRFVMLDNAQGLVCGIGQIQLCHVFASPCFHQRFGERFAHRGMFGRGRAVVELARLCHTRNTLCRWITPNVFVLDGALCGTIRHGRLFVVEHHWCKVFIQVCWFS